MGPRKRICHLVLLTCLSATPLAHAQDAKTFGDFHTQADPGRRLYSISAFAHGHRHGYEEGFRAADLEIHVGRLQRTLLEKDVPKADYKKEYGDKKHFRRGFIYGFMAGYRDSYSEQGFRLVEWTAEVPPLAGTSDLPEADAGFTPSPRLRGNFDEGMLHGYQAGLNTPVNEADARRLAARAKQSCSLPDPVRPDGYCDGFIQGFLLGVNDHTQLAPPGPVTAPGIAQNDSRP